MQPTPLQLRWNHIRQPQRCARSHRSRSHSGGAFAPQWQIAKGPAGRKCLGAAVLRALVRDGGDDRHDRPTSSVRADSGARRNAAVGGEQQRRSRPITERTATRRRDVRKPYAARSSSPARRASRERRVERCVLECGRNAARGSTSPANAKQEAACSRWIASHMSRIGCDAPLPPPKRPAPRTCAGRGAIAEARSLLGFATNAGRPQPERIAKPCRNAQASASPRSLRRDHHRPARCWLSASHNARKQRTK